MDLLYWVCAGLLVFAGIYRINQGILRSFLFLGIISGAFLTYLTIKPLFEKICYIILEVPVRFVKKISKKYINWLLFFCKRCKILVKQSANQYKNSTRNRLQMRRIGYNHLGMFGISLIVLILILTLMAQSRDLKESLAGYETRAEALSQQIEEEQARTQEIEDLKQYMLTDEYAEQAAREKLGLVKENEIIFQEEK